MWGWQDFICQAKKFRFYPKVMRYIEGFHLAMTYKIPFLKPVSTVKTGLEENKIRDWETS